jgi:hypothetical protein
MTLLLYSEYIVKHAGYLQKKGGSIGY